MLQSIPFFMQVLIAAHSWGETVARNFLFWVERQEPGWTEKHVAVLLNIAGYPLGVPKVRRNYIFDGFIIYQSVLLLLVG